MRIATRLIVLVSVILASSSTFAIDVRPGGLGLDAKVLTVAPVKPNVDPVSVNAYLNGLTWTAWNAAHGGRWTAQFDTLTGHPRRVYGGAIPWVPGAANTLTGSATNADLERVARDFIAANQSVIGIANANLTFVSEPATPTRSGRVRYAVFDYSINGVPVENGRLLFAVNNGNMIYWHSANTASVPAVTTPAVTAEQALANLFAYAGVSGANVVQQPTLKLLPRNGAGALLAYQLVYQTAFRIDGSNATWAAYVDALTGTVIAFADASHYADEGVGRVRGGVRPAKANDAEVIRSFPFAAVDGDLGNTATSANGIFTFRGGRTSTSLSGRFFDAFCTDCPSQTYVGSTNGRLELGAGGEGHIGNGVSTPAERTGFFHTNVARQIANKWLDLSWLKNDTIALNVNISATCNAYYSGNTLNFYRAGNNCANTGEIRDVMQHEWGHGLDDHDGDQPGYDAALGLGDMATGEAVGDHVALFVDHDSCIGQSFQNGRNTGVYTVDPATNQIATCDGVRNLDEHRSLRGSADTRPVVSGLLTLSNVTAKCPGPPISTGNPLQAAYIGPMAREGHCEGEIWGQTAYHLVNSLATGRAYGTAKYDANGQYLTYAGDPIGDSAYDGSKNPGYDRDQAWTIAERLFFESRPMVTTYAPSTVQAMGPSAYDGYLVVDDTGDGLLPNGTPNAAYINDAFIHHQIQETGISLATQRTTSLDTKDCTAPAAPSVTLTQGIASGTQSVTISWTPVAGAASYTVLRNERRDDVFLEVARVGASTTSVTDLGVDNGVSYNYRVQASAAGACFAVSPGGVKSITIAQPDAVVRRVKVDDALKGNNDGQLDAGEKAQLTVILGNDGLASLSNVSASLTSATAGVNVTKGGPRTFGTIAAGGEAFSSSYYEVALDATGGLCGTDAILMLTTTTAQGAFTIPLTLPIGESGPNCTVVGRAYAQPLSVSIVSDAAGTCGDGDLTPDPGETVRVDVVVNNVGDAVARNVNITLASSASYLTVTPSTINIDTLGPLGTDVRTASFFVKVGADAPHDGVATLTANVTSSGRTVPSSRAITTPINRDLLLKTYDYDFESGSQGWTSSDAAGWHLTNTALTTGNSTYVWHSNYSRLRCELLTSPQYEFSATSSVTFDVAVLTEEGFDGVNVQVSVDGGQTWITAPSTYNFQADGSGCMAAGEGLFSGNEPSMQRVTADLSQFAGYRGQIRFKFSGDDLLDYPVAGGAWIDNVSAKAMVVSVPSAGCR